jgi:hypothetical protein
MPFHIWIVVPLLMTGHLGWLFPSAGVTTPPIEHNSQAEYEESMNLPIAVKKEQFITSLDGEVQNPSQEM